MKRMKKMFSLLLAVIMVLAMAAPGFAETTGGEGTGDPAGEISTTPLIPAIPNSSEGKEDDGSITIDNVVKKEVEKTDEETGETTKVEEEAVYKAYKIFDVTYSGRSYAYSISDGSLWLPVIAKKVGEAYVSDVSGITLTKAASQENGKDVYYITVVADDFSAPGFAAMLYEALEDEDFKTSVEGGAKEFTNGVASGLDLGYYFVTTTSGALCNLTTTNPDITIHDKNDVPFDKTDDAEDVEIGQTVNYTIKGKVPDTTGFTQYDYIIKDEMSEGLTFNSDSLEVKVGSTALGSSGYTYEPDGNKFTLTIPIMDKSFGEEIIVTYNATVNDKAVSVVSENKATLTYSNNPADSTKTHTTPEDKETVYSAKIVIDKYAEGDKSAKLAGAEFKLKNSEGKFYQYTVATDTQPAKVNWVDNQADGTSVTTGDHTTTDSEGNTTTIKGYAEFPGLKNGTYKLLEVKAPTGYNLLAEEVEVTVEGTTNTTTLTATKEVANNTGTILPGTGGIGTTIFYAAGIILMAGAVFFVIRRKRA